MGLSARRLAEALGRLPGVRPLAGGIGFLTRLPLGRDGDAWDRFRRTPAVLPVVGALVGVLLVAPLALAPPPVAAACFVAWVYLVTGVNHADGLADLGDAAAVHGDRADRVGAMKDTDVGVGGTLAVSGGVVALALAGFGLARADLPVAGAAVVAVETGAKLGLAALACLGSARHEGLGSQLTGPNRPRDLLAPAGLVGVGGFLAALASQASAGGTTVAGSFAPAAGGLLAAVIATLAVLGWARSRLGGVSGDVFGAANELSRLAGLLVGLALLA